MSEDQGEPQERPAAAGSPHPERNQKPAGQLPAGGQASGNRGPAQPDPPEAQAGRSIRDQAAADQRERQQREENLRGYGDFGDVHAGRDFTGQMWSHADRGNINHAGGNITYNYAASADEDPKVSLLQRRDVEQIETCLVPSTTTSDITKLLVREHVVFVRGTTGTGRSTAATAALLAWARALARSVGEQEEEGEEKQERVGVIYGAGSPLRLDDSHLHGAHGYVLDGSGPQWAAKLDEYSQHLRELAGKNDCRFVVLLPQGRSYPPRPTVDHRPPPAEKVFFRWLEYFALAAGLKPDLPGEVSAAIQADLHGESSPGRTVDLADHVAGLLGRDAPPGQILSALPARTRDQIRTRLDETRPIVGRCFMVSAAVLDGLPEVVVSDAALELASCIDETWPVNEAKRNLRAWEKLRSWLDYADADADRADAPGGGRSVRLNRASARRATLQVLWEDHPTIRDPLIAWLRGLTEAADSRVQLKAAHAAGMLAALDFDAMMARVLMPWARSERRRHHQLAAMMLEAAAQDKALFSRVQDQLQQLARGARTQRLVATYAYGSKIGLDDPGGALRVLHRMAYLRSADVHQAIAAAIDYLYSPTTAGEIVNELAGWVSSGWPTERSTAALAFVRLAIIDSRDPARPPLYSYPAGSGLVEQLAALWRNALTLKASAQGTQGGQILVPDAWPALSYWVSKYDENPTIHQLIGDLFTGNTPDAGRLRKAFSLYLLHWRCRKTISADLYGQLSVLLKG